MTRKHAYLEAKEIISNLCEAASSGEYSDRENFMAAIARNPHVAVQGYNAFGKIFYWNEASAHLYGYRESEAVNQDLVELILPPEMRQFARDMIFMARKTGKTPEAGACDLLNRDGEYVTVYSGHVVFQWEQASTPEFYCLDLAIDSDPEGVPAATAR